MKVKFNGTIYEKNKRNGRALKNLCFNIFKKYLEHNQNLNYIELKNIFNKWHCNNNFVLLSSEDWAQKTEDLKKRYFDPIEYNGLTLYFTTQWGNNGGDCDNINNMIQFAKEQNYDIEVEVQFEPFYGLWVPRNSVLKNKALSTGVWYRENAPDENFERKKIESIPVGAKVFLYENIADVKIQDTPFAEYLPQEYFSFGHTVVKVKCVGIGKVVSTNLEDLSVTVNWDEDYQGNEWYLYTRQNGVWWFDGKTQDKHKAQALYDIVFNGKEQDYKWWAENGGFSVDILSEQKINKNNKIKNITLYGSPGVGKTHNTKKLISLIKSGKSDKEIFETIKNNEHNNGIDIDDIEERIKFVTFHQSFGYEDFIEGFRPNEEGNIELEEGVFKSLCQRAQKNLEDSRKPSEAIHKERKFNTILNDFTEKIENLLENNGIYPLTENIYIFDIEEDAFRYKGDNWNIHSAGLGMRFEILEKLYLSNVKSRQDVKKVDGIGGLATQHATYFWKFLEKLYTFESQKSVRVEDVQKVERKNYYLVIDEINRGNISKIFGELITLIEEDKRDTLEVTLPYSKQTFKIPSNLYIIGTMNSTDKSIALIDIALRRRFTFLKMEPNPDLVTHTKAQEIMLQLNQKITNTLGLDYVLGHSYFMKIENDDDLEFVLEYKIKPLLEEYYYGDERLDEVLALCESKKND